MPVFREHAIPVNDSTHRLSAGIVRGLGTSFRSRRKALSRLEAKGKLPSIARRRHNCAVSAIVWAIVYASVRILRLARRNKRHPWVGAVADVPQTCVIRSARVGAQTDMYLIRTWVVLKRFASSSCHIYIPVFFLEVCIICMRRSQERYHDNTITYHDDNMEKHTLLVSTRRLLVQSFCKEIISQLSSW